jgi:hypothetical protein
MNAEEYMSVTVKSAPENATKPNPPASASSEQFRAWATGQEGQHLWSERQIPISVERICHALDQTCTETHGLLISPQGTIILSAIRQNTFERLEPHYRAAAATGLCFWWESGLLTHIQESGEFLLRVRTLPSFANCIWRTRRRIKKFGNSGRH